MAERWLDGLADVLDLGHRLRGHRGRRAGHRIPYRGRSRRSTVARCRRSTTSGGARSVLVLENIVDHTTSVRCSVPAPRWASTPCCSPALRRPALSAVGQGRMGAVFRCPGRLRWHDAAGPVRARLHDCGAHVGGGWCRSTKRWRSRQGGAGPPGSEGHGLSARWENGCRTDHPHGAGIDSSTWPPPAHRRLLCGCAPLIRPGDSIRSGPGGQPSG